MRFLPSSWVGQKHTSLMLLLLLAAQAQKEMSGQQDFSCRNLREKCGNGW
jgi:hypothetical protein